MDREYQFHAEPVVGHRVEATLTERKTNLTEQLDEVATQLDLQTQDRRKVTIEVGDVAWDHTNEVTMSLETFTEIAKWVNECTDD